jgi:PncC family amidohydrolase
MGSSAAAREIAHRIATLLVERGETLAVAETAAGGLISAALVAEPGASAWFLGGAVVYSGAAKAGWLGLAPERFASQGVVSEAGARAMAEAVRRALGATWGLAEAGIAGPQTGRRSSKPPGLAYLAVAGPRPAARQVLTGLDERTANQAAFADAALTLLEAALGAHTPRGAPAGRSSPTAQ